MGLGLTALEKEISAQLQPVRDDLVSEGTLVRALPETASEYGSYAEKGIEVIFPASRSTQPETTVRQETDIDILCRIVAPKRYTDDPLVERAVCEWMLDACIDQLAGYRPTGGISSIYFAGHALQVPEDGRWTILATFRFKKLLVPKPAPGALAAVIQRIISNDEKGTLSDVSS